MSSAGDAQLAHHVTCYFFACLYSDGYELWLHVESATDDRETEITEAVPFPMLTPQNPSWSDADKKRFATSFPDLGPLLPRMEQFLLSVRTNQHGWLCIPHPPAPEGQQRFVAIKTAKEMLAAWSDRSVRRQSLRAGQFFRFHDKRYCALDVDDREIVARACDDDQEAECWFFKVGNTHRWRKDDDENAATGSIEIEE